MLSNRKSQINQKNSHYTSQLETCIKRDAFGSGLGAALERFTVNGLKSKQFASRFISGNGERYSIIELELLGVVGCIKWFKNFLYGQKFSVITNQRALVSALKEHRSNKSYNNFLWRWEDRLSPYQFKTEHLSGARMGLVDYIFCNPYQPARSISKFIREILVVTLSQIQTDANLIQK